MLFLRKWLLLKTVLKSVSTHEVQRVSLTNIFGIIRKISTSLSIPFFLTQNLLPPVYPSGSGNVRITLKDMKDCNYTQMEVAEKISKEIRSKTMARSFVQQQSSFGGRRGSMPVQYVLQATNLEKLEEVLPKFMAKVYENPVFQMADVDLKFSKPEARIQINRDKSSIMGVKYQEYCSNIAIWIEWPAYGIFLYRTGKQYEILGEINRQQRNKPADLKAIYVRSSNGDMIQLDNLIELESGIAPPKLYRYNRFVSATISAGLADGKTIRTRTRRNG